MDYTWQFGFVWKYKNIILGGIAGTFEITFWAFLFATIVALNLCLMSLSHLKIFKYPAIAYVETCRAIPTLVGIVWVYYSLPIFTSVSLAGNASAIIGLTILRSSYMAEVFRAGIQSIDKGQMESARAIGMSYLLAMRRIILPQAVRRMIPPFMNQFVTLLQLTSVASIISATEILHEANEVIQLTFRPLEVYTLVALLYFVLIFPIARFSRFLEKKQLAH